MLKLIFTNNFCIENIGQKEKYITKLENTIIKYNSELLLGRTFVDDDTYNNCIELLEMLRPNSPVLSNDKPIQFIKELNEDISNEIECKVSDMNFLKFYLNPQGLNVRLVYEYGELTEAFTIGRSFKCNDVLDLMISIITDRNDLLSDMEYVEIEGCLVLPLDNMGMARELCYIKNPYQGVFSILNHNEETNEIDNLEDILHFIATDIKMQDIPFGSVNDKYTMLESYDFITPEFFEIEKTENLIYDLEDALARAEDEKFNYYYPTDGIRLLVNTEDIILMRVGSWSIKTAMGIVKEIEWVDEKGKKVPKLIFQSPVMIAEDVEITEFVLNSINLLLILDITIGDYVTFAYFGNMGILPISKNNEIILN